MSARIAAQAITADLIDRLPIMGGALVLISIIGIVTRLWLGSEARHRVELDRIGTAHEVELHALNGRIDKLRKEMDELRAELDEERRLRWRAQDAAAERVRKLRGGGQG